MFECKGFRKYPGCCSCVTQNLGRAHVKKSFFTTNSMDKANIYIFFSSINTCNHALCNIIFGFDERRFFMTLIMDVPLSQTFSLSILCF